MISAALRPAQSKPGTFSTTRRCAISSRTLASASGTELRRDSSTVDCVTGNVSQVRQFLADGSAAVSDMEYFDNGNLRSVTGPANRVSQRYRLDYGYDTVVGVHIESIVNSFGHRTTTTHNLRYGQPELTTDQNGQRLRIVRPADGSRPTITLLHRRAFPDLLLFRGVTRVAVGRGRRG